MGQQQLLQRHVPVLRQPGHGTGLGECQGYTPRGVGLHLPAIDQAGQGCAPLGLFGPQFSRFPVGQQEDAPPGKGAQIGLLQVGSCVEAAEYGPVQADEGVVDLFGLPADEIRHGTDPAGFHRPFQPLRVGVASHRQRCAGQLQHAQLGKTALHQPAKRTAAAATRPPPASWRTRW